ncbi:MAG: hypothetical protein IK100_11465 [Muribaculaceae bacterium]|nr:hypothetical protein [Muribaculaceae bacterium]MBR5119243.1 hypothetical protein [Muribaculaceae bacterium]
MRKILTILLLLSFAVAAWAGEQTILITSKDASGVYYTSKGGVKMEMSGGMNNEGFMVQRHYDQINFRSYNFKIKKIVFRCLDNSVEGDNNSFYWGPTTMYIAPNTSVNNVVAGTLTTPYNNSTYMAEWECSPTYPEGLPIGQQLTIKCQGHPVRFAYIEITIDKEDGDMYELVTNSNQIVTGDKTYMLVHRRQSSDTQGDALSSNQENGSTSGNFESTKVDLLNNGFLARATGDVMFLRFSTGGSSNYPYRIIAGGSYLRTESSNESSPTEFATKRLTRVNNLPSNTDYVNTSLGINSSTTGGTNGFDWYAMLTYEATTGFRIRHYNGKMQFRNITSSSTQNTNLALQRVFLYKPAQKYEVFTETDGNGTITLRDGIVVDGTHNYSQMMDNVSFIVAPTAGYKIKNVTITNLTDNIEITPTITTTTLGQNYAFSMPGSDVRVNAEFEEVTYHNINMVIKPSAVCGNILLTEGYVVQQDLVKSYEGQTVVFNVSPNLKNINNENAGYFELSYVTVTDGITGVETTLAADDQGNYSFTMPDNPVTITAYFYDDDRAKLWLLGTANGETWHTYGPRFNYDDDNTSNHYGEYYIDVYFKGTGDYALNTGDDWGEFRVTWLDDPDDNWGNIQGQGKQGHPWATSEDPSTNYQHVYENGGVYRLADGQEYGLDYSNGWYYYGYNNEHRSFQEDYKFTIDPGIYRIYVGTQTSADAGHLGLNVLKAVKRPVVLTFDPAGGATAAEAVEVGQGQEVILAGDLYNKIKAINPNEADANFKYKYNRSIDGTSYTGDATTVSAGESTTASLDVVNEGGTVTKLEAVNYLGWIHADNTGYYKVIETPLHWIEENGVKDKTYTVSDQLQGVFAKNGKLWCKDLGDISIVKTTPNDDQIDFLATTLTAESHIFGDEMRIGGWDQSNWVELDFSAFGDQADGMAEGLVGHFIKASTIRGVYSDDVNYTITIDANKEPLADGATSYVPNIYCTSNFIEGNLMIGGNVGPTVNNKTYYFLNPKIQEYAIITYCMWDDANQIMVTPNNTPFSGAACIGRWDLNQHDNQLSYLDAAAASSETCNNQYEFHIIVQRTDKSYGSPTTSKDAPSLKPNQAASEVIRTQPLDLRASSPLPTAISIVGTQAQVVDVEYVNVAGMRSSKPFNGVNIVVTRYSDGSTTTTKIVK